MLAVPARCYEPKLSWCWPAICDADPHSAWRHSQHGNPILGYCWLSVVDGGPALAQLCVNVSSLTACMIEIVEQKWMGLTGWDRQSGQRKTNMSPPLCAEGRHNYYNNYMIKCNQRDRQHIFCRLRLPKCKSLHAIKKIFESVRCIQSARTLTCRTCQHPSGKGDLFLCTIMLLCFLLLLSQKITRMLF